MTCRTAKGICQVVHRLFCKVDLRQSHRQDVYTGHFAAEHWQGTGQHVITTFYWHVIVLQTVPVCSGARSQLRTYLPSVNIRQSLLYTFAHIICTRCQSYQTDITNRYFGDIRLQGRYLNCCTIFIFQQDFISLSASLTSRPFVVLCLLWWALRCIQATDSTLLS